MKALTLNMCRKIQNLFYNNHFYKIKSGSYKYKLLSRENGVHILLRLNLFHEG